MAEKNSSLILSHIKTKEDMISFLEYCDLYASNKFSTKKVPLNKKWDELFAGHSAAEKGGAISELKEKVRRQKLIKVKMAFRPSEDFINALHSHLNKKCDGAGILDINFDSNNEPGAVITLEGKYLDLTYKTKVNPIIKEITCAK